MQNPMPATEDEWKKALTPEQYKILREKGTDAPFTGEYYHAKDKGTYLCAACGQELFSSETKYDSGSGWPSFWEPVAGDKVSMATDETLGMPRVEIMCSRCGSHLGHVFDDGPAETSGKRFCVNSTSLTLKKKE